LARQLKSDNGGKTRQYMQSILLTTIQAVKI